MTVPRTGGGLEERPAGEHLDLDRLRDEQHFLKRSLEDLDSELESGELDRAEHERLRQRDVARLERVERQLAGAAALISERSTNSAARFGPDTSRSTGSPATAEPVTAEPTTTEPTTAETTTTETTTTEPTTTEPTTTRRRSLIGWSALACFLAAGLVLGLALAGVAPFTSASQTIPVSVRIQTELAEAATLAENHKVMQAVAVYDDVLSLDPRQPEALSEGGWLVRLAGLSGHRPKLVGGGDAEIAEAVRIAPGLAVPRAYYAVLLFQDVHSPAASVRQFDAMLADKPTAVLVKSVRSVAAKAFKAAHMPLPAQLRP